MSDQIYTEVSKWMHRNAREVELCLWKALFEHEPSMSVANALLAYQNEDGGFGHALEADNWNPNSTPISTSTALKYLKMVQFFDLSHPVYQGIIRYLKSGKGRFDKGWMFNLPDNNFYPRAPWWTYSEDENAKEWVGVTAVLDAFLLRSLPTQDPFYEKALEEAKSLILLIGSEKKQGDMELEGLTELLQTMIDLKLIDGTSLLDKLKEQAVHSVCLDSSRWHEYVKRPSTIVTSKDTELYLMWKDIIEEEVQWTLEHRGEDGVWPITWKWYGMDQYEREFTLSENWWKGLVAIEKTLFLRTFRET